jgi:hypothetical protein
MPHVSTLEKNLCTHIALSVVEEVGKYQVNDDFQMVIKYIKGGVYPKPPKHTPPSPTIATASATAVCDADVIVVNADGGVDQSEKHQ